MRIQEKLSLRNENGWISFTHTLLSSAESSGISRSFGGLPEILEDLHRSYEDLLTAVKKRKLKWYGHITRSIGLAKMIRVPWGFPNQESKWLLTLKNGSHFFSFWESTTWISINSLLHDRDAHAHIKENNTKYFNSGGQSLPLPSAASTDRRSIWEHQKISAQNCASHRCINLYFVRHFSIFVRKYFRFCVNWEPWMILQGTVQGGRRKGRQKKRWEDNIMEWTGLNLGEALRKAENREGWGKVVARSSLVPQWSTRLRDKWCHLRGL